MTDQAIWICCFYLEPMRLCTDDRRGAHKHIWKLPALPPTASEYAQADTDGYTQHEQNVQRAVQELIYGHTQSAAWKHYLSYHCPERFLHLHLHSSCVEKNLRKRSTFLCANQNGCHCQWEVLSLPCCSMKLNEVNDSIWCTSSKNVVPSARCKWEHIRRDCSELSFDCRVPPFICQSDSLSIWAPAPISFTAWCWKLQESVACAHLYVWVKQLIGLFNKRNSEHPSWGGFRNPNLLACCCQLKRAFSQPSLACDRQVDHHCFLVVDAQTLQWGIPTPVI